MFYNVFCVTENHVRAISEENLYSKVRDAADGLHALLAEIGAPVRISVLVCWRLGKCVQFSFFLINHSRIVI